MNKRNIFLLLLLIAIIGGIYGWREFNRSAPEAGEMPVSAHVSAGDLLAAFEMDEAAAQALYVGEQEQVVQVSGKIRSIDPVPGERVNVVLATDNALAGVVGEFAEGAVPVTWKEGDEVVLKGICTGMLMDVVLVRCVAVE